MEVAAVQGEHHLLAIAPLRRFDVVKGSRRCRYFHDTGHNDELSRNRLENAWLRRTTGHVAMMIYDTILS
jgi:hypothetical protein